MEDFEKTKANRNGGKVFHERFSHERLDAIKRIITNFEQQGRKKRFSISVDGELIVPCTSDSEQFIEYMEFLEPHTEHVEVRLYFGDSPNSNRYIFHLKEQALEGLNQNGLGALEVENKVQDALEKQKMEADLLELQKKVKRLKRKLRDAKDQLGDKQTDFKELISQGMQLYGTFSSKSTPQIQGSPLGQAEVQIEKEQSECDKFYEELKEKYSEKDLEKALKTWEVFASYPDLRQEFYSIINAKTNQNGQA